MHFEIFLLNIENNICNTPLPCSSYDLTLTPKLINFLTNSGFRNFIALNKYALNHYFLTCNNLKVFYFLYFSQLKTHMNFLLQALI